MSVSETAWMFSAVLAIVFTVGSISFRRSRNFEVEVIARFAGSGIGLYFWVFWAINSFSVIRYTETGTKIPLTYDTLGFLGVIIAFVIAIDLVFSVLSLLEHMDMIDFDIENFNRGV